MASKICRKDEVIILSGKNKGKRGKVKKIFSNGKAIVEGINIVKKHMKPLPSMDRPGGILEKESVINISNIAIFNINTNKKDGVKFKINDGKKIRLFKSNGKIIK